jgi:hypothetical protein
MYSTDANADAASGFVINCQEYSCDNLHYEYKQCQTPKKIKEVKVFRCVIFG